MRIRNGWVRTVVRSAVFQIVLFIVLNIVTDAALFFAPGQILRLNEHGLLPILRGNDALVDLIHHGVVSDLFGLSCSDKFVIAYTSSFTFNVPGAMHDYHLGKLEDFNLVRVYFSDIVALPERRSLSQERILEINRIMIERCSDFALSAYDQTVQDR